MGGCSAARSTLGARRHRQAHDQALSRGNHDGLRSSVCGHDPEVLRHVHGSVDLRDLCRRSGRAGCGRPARRGAGDGSRQRRGHARACAQAGRRRALCGDRPQPAHARLCRQPARARQPHRMEAGGRAQPSVRGGVIRRCLLPVRRDVLSRSGRRLCRGASRAEAGRAFHLQCLGSHRRECLCQ
ncbi:hypothetical protein D3C86_1491500 [compost metagenome]